MAAKLEQALRGPKRTIVGVCQSTERGRVECQCWGSVSSPNRVDRAICRSIVGMVEEIECFTEYLQTESFAKLEVARDTQFNFSIVWKAGTIPANEGGPVDATGSQDTRGNWKR